MDTRIAANISHQMAQFFRVFKDVEEVLEAATRADNLKGEVEQAIALLQQQKSSIESEVAASKAVLLQSKLDYAKAKEKHEAELHEQTQRAVNDLTSRRTGLEAEIAVLQGQREAAHRDLVAYLESASVQRQEADRNLAALQKKFDDLKAKVAALYSRSAELD